MGKTVKWGVLGTANIAKWCTIPGMQEANNCELYAIAGRSLEKAESFKEQYGFEKAYGSYDELIEDGEVQALYIPLPNHLHLPWVTKALKAGKHVLCEKPLAINASEAEEMFRVAKENGVYLMEAYAYLHSPYVASLKEDIQSGILGKIEYIESAFIGQEFTEDFRLHRAYGGGAIYDLGVYSSSMILSLVDSDVTFANGVRASFNAGFLFKAGSNARFDRLFIHGSKADIRSEVEYNQAGDFSYRIITKEGEIVRKGNAPSNYRLEVEQLGRCILDGEKPLITPEFSVKNAKLLDRILPE